MPDAENEEFGRFVVTDDDEMDFDGYHEDWEPYVHSRHPFYPICVGEILDKRYQIEHKIGFGGFSTVWMAQDLKEKRIVALKILGSNMDESPIHHILRKHVQDTSHLVLSSANFKLSGANGLTHEVLVLPLLGQCVDIYGVNPKPMPTRMSAAEQLLETLKNLHEAGIVHRDINEGNCMWGMESLDHLDRKTRYDLLQPPLKQRIPVDKLWKQGELVKPMEIPDNCCPEKFYLSDFGLAMKLGDSKVPQGVPPPRVCSPERLHGAPPSFACDMWSYMMVFSTLYLRYPLPCDPMRGTVSLFGPLPKHLKRENYIVTWDGKKAWKDEWYDADTKPTRSLAAEIHRLQPNADPAEKELVHSIMMKVLIYDPTKRLSAAQLLEDSSFKALMRKYGC